MKIITIAKKENLKALKAEERVTCRLNRDLKKILSAEISLMQSPVWRVICWKLTAVTSAGTKWLPASTDAF